MISAQEFGEITERIAEIGMSSLTSLEYRIDVLKLLNNLSSPGPLVEVGSCHGGFTALLARQAHLDERKLYAVDILSKSVAETAYTVKYCSADYEMAIPIIHEGDLFSFAIDRADTKPAAIIIDASHEFYHVYQDICTALLFFPNTEILVFHDYALRELTAPNVIVDKAIHYIFGDDAWLTPLGNFGTGTVVAAEHEVRFYAVEGRPEGVAIWRKHIPLSAFRRAIEFFTVEMQPKFAAFQEIVNVAAMRIHAG